MEPTLSEVENLAREAGKILRDGFIKRPGFEAHHQLDHKGRINLVTEVDRRSEAFIVREIQKRHPEDQIVAEEGGAIQGRNCCKWFIDPLDGTMNFAHGVPIFTVSIAFARNDHLHFGVVYDPMQDECFSAERGNGAWLNGEPIRVSSIQNLVDSLLVTGFSYNVEEIPANVALFGKLMKLTQGVRRLGAASLDLCYVAAGRLDGFWELQLEPWDIAAGALIAQEAGAVVTDLTGGESYIEPPCPILAANRYLHPQLMDVLSQR